MILLTTHERDETNADVGSFENRSSKPPVKAPEVLYASVRTNGCAGNALTHKDAFALQWCTLLLRIVLERNDCRLLEFFRGRRE